MCMHSFGGSGVSYLGGGGAAAGAAHNVFACMTSSNESALRVPGQIIPIHAVNGSVE